MKMNFRSTGAQPRFRWIFGLLALVFLGISPSESQAGQRFSGVRVPFVTNSGQADSAVAFYAPTFSGTVFVTRAGKVVYSLPSGKKSSALTETAVGGRPRPTGGTRASASVSEFRGNDRKRWRTGLRTFEDVSLGEVWPGVSLDLRARGRGVEKVFTVRPGADPASIRMSVRGARRLRVDSAGALVAETGSGAVTFTAPSATQTDGRGTSSRVRVAYELHGRQYGFRLADRDAALPVVIDPVFQATYLGGDNDDEAFAIAVNPTSGDVYVAGDAFSTDFPGTAGGGQPAKGAGSFDDAFVARFTPGLTALEQATYLGGSGVDAARALAIDPASGDVYVAGYTDSTDFPGVTGGAQPQKSTDSSTTIVTSDAFVARLSSSLTTLEQATYLGGNNVDQALALAVHPTSGEVYVAGWTLSKDFPRTSGGAHSGTAGEGDAFVARLSSDLKTLNQATYAGGDSYDQANAIAIHPASGDVYIGGFTLSVDFRGTSGGAFPSHAADSGNTDGFVARFNAGLTAVEQVTYLGGTGGDVVRALAIHPVSGDVYAAGYTDSTDFPGTSGAAQAGAAGGADAFVARLTFDLSSLERATYLGGSGDDVASALAIHPATGDVYVAGVSSSADFPGTSGAAQAANGGGGFEDAFVAHLTADLATLAQATYLGGGGTDAANALAIHPISGDVYVAGTTTSSDFPGTAGGAFAAHAADGGSEDAFVAALPATLRPIPAALQSVSVSRDSVAGGFDLTGSVTLSAVAPAGGAVVTLSASGPVSVPQSVLVPEGSASASFSVTTTAVSSPTAAAVAATYLGVTESASFTVDPVPIPVIAPVEPPPLVPIAGPEGR